VKLSVACHILFARYDKALVSLARNHLRLITKKKQAAIHTLLQRDGCAYSTILEPIYIITGTLTCVGWIHFRENYILGLTDTETRESINKLSYVPTSKVIIFMYKIMVIRYPPVEGTTSVIIVTEVILATKLTIS
jgi:hypothetical protein